MLDNVKTNCSFQRQVSRRSSTSKLRCENHHSQNEQKESHQIDYTEFKVLTAIS